MKVKSQILLVTVFVFASTVISLAQGAPPGPIGLPEDRRATPPAMPAEQVEALARMAPKEPPALIKALGQVPYVLYPPILTFLIGSMLIVISRIKSGQSIAPAELLATLNRQVALEPKATRAMLKRDNRRKLDLKYIVDNLNVWKMVEGRYPNAMDAEQHSEFLVALPRTPHDPLDGQKIKGSSEKHGYYYDNIAKDGKINHHTFRLWTFLENEKDPALEISQTYQKEHPNVLLVTEETDLNRLFPQISGDEQTDTKTVDVTKENYPSTSSNP